MSLQLSYSSYTLNIDKTAAKTHRNIENTQRNTEQISTQAKGAKRARRNIFLISIIDIFIYGHLINVYLDMNQLQKKSILLIYSI